MKKIAILMIMLLLLVGCKQHNIDLEDSINSVVEDESENVLKINSFTEFGWDKAFLFTPYSTEQEIEERLETKFNDKSNIDFRDDIYLLVFLHEDKVVQYVEMKRQGSDFSIGAKEYLTPTEDVINIERY